MAVSKKSDLWHYRLGVVDEQTLHMCHKYLNRIDVEAWINYYSGKDRERNKRLRHRYGSRKSYGRIRINKRSVHFSIARLFDAVHLPEQVTPSPMNPGLHMQSKEPAVFVQVAFEWQLCFPDPHSSTSEQQDVHFSMKHEVRCTLSPGAPGRGVVVVAGLQDWDDRSFANVYWGNL